MTVRTLPLLLRSCLTALLLASFSARAAKPTFNGKVTASRDLEDRIDVTWTALYNATSVTIWRGTTEYFSSSTPVATVSVSGAGTWTQGTWSDTTAVVLSASYFTEFHYWIEAKNADGSTLEQGKHDKGYRNPGDPGNPTLTVHPGASTTGVDLSWTRADYAVTYEIYRGTTESALFNGTATKIGTVSGTSSNLTFTDSGATPGVNYWYEVDARNPAGVGHGNDGCSYRAVSLSRSPSSFTLSSAAQDKSVSVTANTSWTASKSAEASWLTLATTSGSENGTLSFSVSRNTSASPRDATVTIRAGAGTDHPKTVTVAVSQNGFVPAAPTGVRATDGTYMDRIRVSWNASDGATSYAVYRSDSASGTKTSVGYSSSTSFDDVDPALVAERDYWYWVKARNQAGDSGFSSADIGWKKDPGPDLSPVYRFWAPGAKSHFFTMNEAEKDSLVANASHIWNFEGVAYYAYRTEATGTVPLYRFYSAKNRGHFYTCNETEKDGLIANHADIWAYEGVAYYVAPVTLMGSLPVYRFWAPGAKHHFYTISEAEKNSLVANASHIWNFEGVAFYAWTAASVTAKGAAKPAAKSTAGPAAADRRAEDGATAPEEDGDAGTDGWRVEVRAEPPEADELAVPPDGPDGFRTVRLPLPPDVSGATVWNAATGEERPVGTDDGGTASFDLPESGAWHWFRAGAGPDAVSLWLRLVP